MSGAEGSGPDPAIPRMVPTPAIGFSDRKIADRKIKGNRTKGKKIKGKKIRGRKIRD